MVAGEDRPGGREKGAGNQSFVRSRRWDHNQGCGMQEGELKPLLLPPKKSHSEVAACPRMQFSLQPLTEEKYFENLPAVLLRSLLLFSCSSTYQKKPLPNCNLSYKKHTHSAKL